LLMLMVGLAMLMLPPLPAARSRTKQKNNG
jgi:hypothetical protein